MTTQSPPPKPSYIKPKPSFKTTILGFAQLITVIAFIIASFMVSEMLKTNTEGPQPRKETTETISLFAQVQNITPSPQKITFSTTGIIEARSEISITPQVSGRIIKINEKFFAGGTFEANETLFEIDPIDFELVVKQRESEVARARTAYNLAEAETNSAIAEWRQLRGNQKAPALVAKQPQKNEAWAALQAAKAELESAKLNLERTRFTLPFAGRIITSSLELGQHVTAGQNYGRLYNVETLEIQTSLKESQIRWLLETQNPDITVNTTYLGQPRTHKATLKRGIAALESRTRFAEIHFGFDTPQAELVPGIFVDVDIIGPQLDNISLVPLSALQKDGIIWAVNKNDQLFKLKAERIFQNDQFIFVKGLTAPSRIVTSKMPGALEGMTIQIEETASTSSKSDGSV